MRYITSSGKGYYGGYGLMNIGTHLLNNIIGLVGHCRSVTATALTGGRPITPDDVVRSPHGMGTIAGEGITAVLCFDNGITATLFHHRLFKRRRSLHGLEVWGQEGRLLWKPKGAWWCPASHVDPQVAYCPLELSDPDGYDPSSNAATDDYAFVDEYVKALDQGTRTRVQRGRSNARRGDHDGHLRIRGIR